jgi:phage gpG-like protein
MSFNEARKISLQLQRYKTTIEGLMTIIGNDAVNHFKGSFRDEGFTDSSLEKWKPRKNKRDDKGRAILTKTGRLRRSIIYRKFGSYGIIITSNVPYAQIHNEGGTIDHKARRQIMNFTASGKLARTRTRKQRSEVSFAQKVDIKAHQTRIPKRQFVGNSRRLVEKTKAKIDAKIQGIFK